MNDALCNMPGIDFSRFELISDLFKPTEQKPVRFVFFHAVEIDAKGDAFVKVYLNHASGEVHANS